MTERTLQERLELVERLRRDRVPASLLKEASDRLESLERGYEMTKLLKGLPLPDDVVARLDRLDAAEARIRALEAERARVEAIAEQRESYGEDGDPREQDRWVLGWREACRAISAELRAALTADSARKGDENADG